MNKVVKKLPGIIQPLFASLFSRPEQSFEEERKRIVLALFLLVGIPTLVSFGIFHFSRGGFTRGLLLFLVAAILTVSLFSLRYLKRALPVYRITAFLLGSYFLTTMVIGGAQGSRIIWVLLFPLIVFFLLGKKEGLLWSAVVFFLSLFFLIDQDSIIGTFPYKTEIRIRFLIAYGLMALMSYIVESARQRYQVGMGNEHLKMQSEITERMRAEEELEKHRHHLEELVEERASELIVANEKLKQEIKERKLAEQALRESETKYSTLVENSKDGIIMIRDGILEFVNKASIELVGYSPEEITGADFLNFVAPDYREFVLKQYADFTEGKDVPSHYEIELLRKNGKTIQVELNAIHIDFEGKPADLVFLRDITERKRAEEALLESEEKFKSLGENAPDIIYTLALDGSFTYVNPAWEAILGYKPEEVLGKYFVDFAKKEEARDYVRIFKHIRDKRKTFKDIDINIVHKDGSTRLFSASGAPNIDKAGQVSGMVGLFKDITDHRRLEARFQQAQRMKAIGTLAGGIAHDFNNLLMGIEGNAALMLLDIDSDHPHHAKLKNIEQYVKNGAELTKQLLGFARGGKYVVKPTDINELVNESSHMFGRTRKDIKINTKFQEDIWTVEVDHGQIEQVLLNLYVNAWQAMPDGGDLYLSTENVILDEDLAGSFSVEPGEYVKISLTDTGVGMDEETQQRVFDPFFTTKEMGRGTGLGLASAYGIIKNHGGIINLNSKKGEGTTFHIYLPSTKKEIAERKRTYEEILKGSETILLVDDEEMIIDIGRQLLDSLGYKVMVAGSGNEALEMYEENKDHIDLVILDMIMPNMSGGNTYDKLKGMSPSVKVLLASGYSINGQAQAILDRGCNAFIQKPFNLKDLSKKIRSVLDKQ